MDWIGFLIAGLVVGFLARLLLPGRDSMGILMTLLVGVAGSLIGGWLGGVLLGRPGGFILAVITAMVLVWVLRRSSSRA